MDKSGVLDPHRMYPRFTPRADDELSMMAEIAVDACHKAMAAAGKMPEDIDAVICGASNMQRADPPWPSKFNRPWASTVSRST